MTDPDEPKSEDDDLERLVNINFKITERERRAFKAWCAVHGMNQTEAFRRGFKLLSDQEGAA